MLNIAILATSEFKKYFFWRTDDTNIDKNTAGNTDDGNTDDEIPLATSGAEKHTNEKEVNNCGRIFKPYFTELNLFHQAPMTKISYTIISELAIVFYYSYYLRTCMTYQWGQVRVQMLYTRV